MMIQVCPASDLKPGDHFRHLWPRDTRVNVVLEPMLNDSQVVYRKVDERVRWCTDRRTYVQPVPKP